MSTLTHPARQTLRKKQRQKQLDAILEGGTARSTRRAYVRDVTYFWAWARLAMKGTLQQQEHYPVSEDTVIAFILDHLGHLSPALEQQLIEQGLRRKPGPLKVSTLRRYLASLSVIHTEHAVPTPVNSPQVRLLLRRAQQLHADQGKRQMRAITKDILEAMIASCDESLRGSRDKALLLVGFASGGRRRGELVNIQVSDLQKIEEGYYLTLCQTKTDQAGKGHTVPIVGLAANALTTWLVQSGIREGALFRGVRGKATLTKRICGDAILNIIKRRIKGIGLDPTDYGAHSLRAGFMTEAAQAGSPLGDAMALSGHRTTNVASAYYRQASLLDNPASHLLADD